MNEKVAPETQTGQKKEEAEAWSYFSTCLPQMGKKREEIVTDREEMEIKERLDKKDNDELKTKQNRK